MQRDEKAGLIQTVPRLAGAVTLLQHLQQFACNVYGPPVAAGLAVLAPRPGQLLGPQRHHSHRSVRRAPPACRACRARRRSAATSRATTSSRPCCCSAPTGACTSCRRVEGSYEGQPPTLPDVIARDRRWAQGNLQHLSIVRASGLTPMGRVHLVHGRDLLSRLGRVGGLAHRRRRAGAAGPADDPELLHRQARRLFPVWPVIDPGAALRLFFATMTDRAAAEGARAAAGDRSARSARASRSASLRAIARRRASRRCSPSCCRRSSWSRRRSRCSRCCWAATRAGARRRATPPA